MAGRYRVVEWSGGGGFAHVAWLFADALAGLGGRDVVLETRTPHELAALPHRHRVRPMWPAAPRFGGLARKVVVALQRGAGWARVVASSVGHRDDVVHLQGADRLAELPFVWALRATGVTVIVTTHNARPHSAGALRSIGPQLLHRSVHGVVVLTDAAARAVRDAAPRVPLLAVRHPSYAPLADGLGTVPPPADDAPLTVAHLGTIKPYKGFDDVAACVALVQRDRPGLRFHVIGRPGGVDVAGAVAGLVPGSVDLDLRHVSVAELADAARSADLVVLGHRSTSESGVALLALAAGAVVVGPRSGAIARLLQSEPSWTFDALVPSEMARVAACVLGEIEADRAAMRARARAVVDAIPSWDDMARQVVDFVESLERTR